MNAARQAGPVKTALPVSQAAPAARSYAACAEGPTWKGPISKAEPSWRLYSSSYRLPAGTSRLRVARTEVGSGFWVLISPA